MAEGRPEGVSALDRMETIEFYHFYKNWKVRQQAIADAYNKA
ncbi:hypothetical protein [Spirosoma sp. 48-14]|nr:hypothetical protein [Spirosoma sp. 48-14]